MHRDYSLLAPSVKVNALDGTVGLVEADVVEAIVAGAGQGPDAVVRHDELFLPAHEQKLLLGEVAHGQIALADELGVGSPGAEAAPVVDVDAIIAAPLGMLSVEGVLVAHDLGLEVGRQARVVLRQA